MSFSPTDLRFGQNIINNYLATIESQQRGRQLDIESQRLQQEHELQSRKLDMLQSMQALQQKSEEQSLAQKYLESGVPPIGATVEKPQLSTPSPESGMTPISQTLGLGANEQRLNIPGLGSVVLPTSEEYARRKGQLGLLEEAPKLEQQRQLQKEIADRTMAIELIKTESASQLKRIESDSNERRAQIAADARRYSADKSYQGRVKAAELSAQKLTGTEKNNFENLKDIENAIDVAQSSLGDVSDPKNKWAEYFNNSSPSEIARTHPNIPLLGGIADNLSGISSKFNDLDAALLAKGKNSIAAQKALARGGSMGARSQSPIQAKNALDALKAQIQAERLNIGPPFKTGGTTPAGEDRHIYFDKSGNIIK